MWPVGGTGQEGGGTAPRDDVFIHSILCVCELPQLKTPEVTSLLLEG